MPQPGGRPFRPTGSDPLSVECAHPDVVQERGGGHTSMRTCSVPEGSATLPRRQTRRRRGASWRRFWRLERRSGRDRRAACIQPKRRASATVGARVVGPALEGAGARVEQARQRAATIRLHHASKAGENPIPAPMGPMLPRGPPVAEPAARYLEEHVTVRCEPGHGSAGATRCVDNGSCRAAMSTGLAVCE